MSKPRLKLLAEFDTLTHAETVRDAAVSEVSSKDVYEEHSREARIDPDTGNPTLTIEWRFNNETDRNDMRDWIQDQLQNVVNAWVTKVTLSWHTCTHDDLSVKDCKTTDYAEWLV